MASDESTPRSRIDPRLTRVFGCSAMMFRPAIHGLREQRLPYSDTAQRPRRHRRGCPRANREWRRVMKTRQSVSPADNNRPVLIVRSRYNWRVVAVGLAELRIAMSVPNEIAIASRGHDLGTESPQPARSPAGGPTLVFAHCPRRQSSRTIRSMQEKPDFILQQLGNFWVDYD
jgi:hypothetical protein